MLGGTFGKILHIDLSSGDIHVEEPGDEFYRLLIGGRAVVAYLLLRDTPPNLDPLSPENILIFAPGIMQGSNLPGAGRHSVGAKSPLTGAIGSSEAGGWWGHEFKHAGYDIMVVHGKAESPVYIWIKDGKVEIRPAEHLWGCTTAEVDEMLKVELDDQRIRVAQIGIAGENQVLYSAIMHDITRAAGRNGMGAVMGSKNLKAVAVRGTLKLDAVDRSKVISVSKWFGANHKTYMGWAAAGIGMGTPEGVAVWGYLGALPTRNFGKPLFDKIDEIEAGHLHEQFLKDRDTCQACPVKCKQVFEHQDDDPDKTLNPVYGGAEYEGIAGFGSNLEISDPVAVLKASELCNVYGVDLISTAMTVAFVMECYEKGIITSEDTGGLEFKWGDPEIILRAVEMIVKREGFGDIMAEGVARMSERLGEETKEFNLTVKGQEVPLHDPRLKHALGVGYALSPIGADHIVNVQDQYYTSDGLNLQRVNSVLAEPLEPISNKGLNEGKLQLMHHEINWQHFQDCAINCHHFSYRYEHMADALTGVTGVKFSVQDVLDVGARAQTLSRLFNKREGFTAADDLLPLRLMQAFDSGPLEGVCISQENFKWAKQRFYELMEWDPITGVPTEQCLKDIKIDRLFENANQLLE